MEDWNEDDSYPNLKCQLIDLCALFFKLCHVRILRVTIVLDIFFINPNTKPLFTFLPFPHGTGRRIQAWGPTPPVPSRDARRRALHRRALAGREAHLGANHPHTLISMNNLATLLEQQGKLNEAGLRSLDGER